MPLGASRLSFLAKTAAEEVAAGRTAVSLTASGNAQIDTAQSQFGGSSALFDGTDDFIDTNYRSSILTSTETIEFWYRPTTTSGAYGIMSQNTQGEGNGFQILYINGGIYVYKRALGSGDGLVGTGSITANTWHHIAVVNNAGTAKLYIDGVLKDTDTGWTGTDDDTDLRFGEGKGLSSSLWDGSRYDMNGFLDEIRISDTARYTAAFTAPTEPFQNDDNTLLLLHMDGTDGSTEFVDDTGTAGFVVGSVSYSGTTDNYSNQSVNTTGAASGLKTPNAITVVFLAKPTYNLERLNIMGISDNNNVLRNNIFINTSGTIRFYNATTSGTSDKTSTETLTNNDWNLVAISKDVNTGQISGWMNGSSITFPSETITGQTFDFDGSATDIGIGTARAGDHGNYMWNGDVAWVGVWPTYTDFTNSTNQDAVWDSTNSRAIFPGTDGTRYDFGDPIIFHYGNESTVAQNQGNIASYTLAEGGSPTDGDHYIATLGEALPEAVATWDGTDFSEITSAFTSDGNTEFLCSWDGTNGQTSATDESSNSHTITFSGSSADISTERNRFGGASVDLNFSSTDSITFGDAGTSAWYNQDTTIECWVYYDTLTGAQASNGLPRVLGSFVTTGGGNYWSFGAKNDGSLQFFYYQGSSQFVTSATGLISAGQWHHIAMTHNNTSGVIELFLDGKNVASATKASGSFSNHGYIRLGNYSGTPDAHVDEIRISHTVRYTPVEATSDTSISFAGGDYGYIDAFPNTSTSNSYSFFSWVKFDNSNLSDNSFVFESFRNGISAFRLEKYQSKLMVNGFNSSNSPMYRAQHNSTISGDTWYAVWVSIDPSSTSNRSFCYQQYGSSTVNVVTSSNSAFYVNITGSYQSGFYDEAKDIGIFARGANGAVASRGDLAEFWMDDVYRDFTNSTNRQKFVDSSGYPVDLGSDGSTPFSAAPPIYLAGSDILTNNRGDSGDTPTYVGSPPNGDAVGS